MAFGISASASSLEFYGRISDGRPFLAGMPPRESGGCLCLFGSTLPTSRRSSSCLGVSSSGCARTSIFLGKRRRRRSTAVCFMMATDEDEEQGEKCEGQTSRELEPDSVAVDANLISEAAARAAERQERKRSERHTYLVAAVMSTLGITSMAVVAVYYRFSWQMEGGEVPFAEMLGTFALSIGAAVGMEFWARWAHRALWHASLWHMHESHHRPREGPFELNDVFAIINAVPAIALLSFGFFHSGILPGLCFGAGLGITLFGVAYMFVHDGLVHRRFPVGPIANVPYFRRVAAAHQIHHSDKFDGVPFGLFMGPKELEEVGGDDELQKEINRRVKLYNSTRSEIS